MIFNPDKFLEKLKEHTHNRPIPTCPYCGGNKFTTTTTFAAILTGTDTKDVKLDVTIPSGMLICNQCGHIEFFALGALGLLDNNNHDNKDEKSNGREKKTEG